MIAALLLAFTAASISGVVHDSSGGTVSGAAVTVRAMSGAEKQVTTGPDGRFTIDAPETGDVTLVVRADGFAEKSEQVPAAHTGELDVVLSPATLLETVTVTPTRTEQRLGDTPASQNIVTTREIEASPALVADDVLRQVPTFSLFRRTSSLVAQPTTQGVSLRGIGPSGQSRTLVLLDGIPFNDPFGGWVYWTRVPLASVDRIEMTDGATSSLYGNYAMGGVINIITSKPTRPLVDLKTQYGTENSPKLDFFAGNRWNKIGAAVEGSFFRTDGFPIVAEIERGPIDNHADVAYRNISGKVDYAASDNVNAFVRAGYFSENRNNGKVGELNDTRWTTVNGGVRVRLPDSSDLQARMFVDVQRAHFNFLAVTNAATTRNLVRLATDQNVPTNGVGGTAVWTKSLGATNVFSAGADWRWIDGDSVEDAYNPAVPPVIIPPVTIASVLNIHRVSGGTQQISGGYLQDIFTPMSQLVITLSARVDHWRNYDGHNLETTVSNGQPTPNNKPSIPERTDTVVSPRAAALYHLSDRVSVWGAANSGFRAPTLTELYRQFSVGAVTTRPNDQLGPERLVGGEAGINVAPAHNVTARLTWFHNQISDPVSNVTLNATTAQKQNLGETRIRGVQTDVEYRIGLQWRVSGAYVYDQAKVTDGGVTNAALVGKYVPQVPLHHGTFQVAYSNPKIANVALSVQAMSLQYNDDQNVNFIPAATLAAAGYDSFTGPGLPGYGSVDLTVLRDLGRSLQVFFGAQNLFDKQYFVQTNPSTIGTPRLMNVGVRVRFSGR
ncbi:MAG TPA: TonB-dependent receptor [Vicinamibacterales bacterium]|nr:TonB-dependent receptor [Vicinamibacterales bacterium]